ncbi:MAG: RDD family protein [Bryobacteraceae bacterium]
MARPAPELYPTARRANAYLSTSAVAHAVSPSVRGIGAALLEEAPPAPETVSRAASPFQSPLQPPYQPKLFTTRELGRVVPIEFYQRPEPTPVRTPRQGTGTRSKRSADLEGLQQQAFDFPRPAAIAVPVADASLSRSSQARTSPHLRRIPVAVPLHRVLAGLLDASMVIAAVMLMTITVHMLIGLSFLGGFWLPALAGSTLLATVGYKLLWIWAETESPGLRWVQLRLVNFDGNPPDRQQRLERFGWSGVSLLAGCLGLVWALVDEESLTWHDHSSKTFLTCFSTPAAH